MTDISGAHIAQALQQNYTLQHLDASHNQLTKASSKLFGYVLGASNKNAELYFVFEFKLVASNVHVCHRVFASGDQATLTSLDVSWNKLAARGVSDILQGLISNTALTHLNVAFNGVGNPGILKIADFLKKNTHLQSLDISHNRFSVESMPTLAKGLLSSLSLVTLKVAPPSQQ